MNEGLAWRFWEDAPDGAIAVAADGQIRFWNRAAQPFLGCNATEAAGQAIRDLLLVERAQDGVRHQSNL